MKKMKLLFVLAAICTLVGVAAADFNIIDRNTFKANTVNGARVDANGYAYTNEAFKDRDRVIKYDAIISDTCALYTADSTAIAFDTHDVARGYLYISATPSVAPAAGTTNSITLAVRVYGHTSALQDSASRYNFVVSSRNNTTIDSLVFNTTQYPMQAVTTPTEYRVVIPFDNATSTTSGNPMKYPRPNGVIIPLRDVTGAWLWSEYTSVMVRHISNSVGSGASHRITVSYRGIAL